VAGFKIWAVGEEVLAADFNAFLQQQVVAVFASAAARDAAITAPTRGQACYVQATAQLLVYDGTAWRPPWNMPWGLVQYAESTAVAGPITGPGNIPGLSFTYTHPAGRRLRLVADLHLVGSVAAAEARAFLTRDAAQLMYRAVYLAVAGRAYAVQSSAIFTSDAAAHTYVAQMGISSGSGQVSTNAAVGLPVFLHLEDVGPAPGALPTLLPAPDLPDAQPKEVLP
jgi:hypothetical protein